MNYMHPKITKRVLVGTLSGVFLEYFDYTLYGFSATNIARSFFGHTDHTTQLELVWMAFALSFLLRPVGSVLFSHFADKYGRRRILLISILLMSLSTMLIGVIPTYDKVGILAPILLLVCRALQGLSVSTEYSGCSTYLLEFTSHRRGLLSGIITSASGYGIFCASLLVLLFTDLPSNLVLIQNWRWPFILAGLIIGVLGSYLRLDLKETPKFLAARRERKLTSFPLITMLKEQPLKVLICVIISSFAGVIIILLEIYLPNYLQSQLGFSKNLALRLSTILALAEAFFAIMWGAFSDRWGRMQTFLIGTIAMGVLIYPSLYLFQLPFSIFYYLAAIILACLIATIDGPMSAYLTASFPTQMRYTGVSVTYNIGVGVIGGLSPVFLTLLQNKLSQQLAMPIGILIAVVVMLGALGLAAYKRV
jgi:MHS family proline/betaine transporter-like MFS transporter